MSILVVWDDSGSGIELYEATGAAAALVRECQDQYINSSDLADDAAVYRFHEAYFYDDEGRERPPSPELRKIDDFDVPRSFDAIVLCGFLP